MQIELMKTDPGRYGHYWQGWEAQALPPPAVLKSYLSMYRIMAVLQEQKGSGAISVMFSGLCARETCKIRSIGFVQRGIFLYHRTHLRTSGTSDLNHKGAKSRKENLHCISLRRRGMFGEKFFRILRASIARRSVQPREPPLTWLSARCLSSCLFSASS